MKEFSVVLGSYVVGLLFEDERFGKEIEDVFEKKPNQGGLFSNSILILGFSSYCIYVDGSIVGEFLPKEQAAYCVVKAVGDLLCENRGGLVVMHASSIAREDAAVCFIGRSGSGKTSLALAGGCSGFDYLGDEYTFLDLGTGVVSCSQMPIHIKERNVEFCRMMPTAKFIKAEKRDEAERIYPWSCAGDFGNCLISRKLRMLIFPCFDEKVVCADAEPVNGKEFIELFLSAAAGANRPSDLLRRMLLLLDAHRVKVMKLSFSSSLEAIALVNNHLQQEEQ